MVNGKVEFLNLQRPRDWNVQAEVAEIGQTSSALTGQSKHLEALRPRDLGGGTDISRIAGGGEADEEAGGATESHDELGEFQGRVDIVGDCRAQRWKAGERDAGHRLLELVGQLRAETGALFLRQRTSRLETFHEFARPVIRIGGAAAVTGDERVASFAEACKKYIGGIADAGGERGELRAAVQQFGDVVAAG